MTILAAIAIDDAALARERVPPPMVPDAALTWAAPLSHGGFVAGVQGLRF
jgi:hypothetical protein